MPKDTTAQGVVETRLPENAIRVASRRGETIEFYARGLARRSANDLGRPVRVVDGGEATGRPRRILAEAVPTLDPSD